MSERRMGVFLIRHGKTKMNSEKSSQDFIRGWQDPPLDEEGKREMTDIVAFIVKLKPERIYSSDLIRASVIAKAAAKECKCPLEISKEFRPWGLGDFQGQPAKDVVPQLQAYIDAPDKKVPGGGESFGTFKSRVLGAVKRVMQRQDASGNNIVILTHFRCLKLVEAWLSKGGADDIDAKVFAANDIPTGGMDLLYRERGKWQFKRELRPKVGVRNVRDGD